MEWSEDNVWSLELDLAAGDYDFKCVVFRTADGIAVDWEPGSNRQLQVKCHAAAAWSTTTYLLDIRLVSL